MTFGDAPIVPEPAQRNNMSLTGIKPMRLTVEHTMNGEMPGSGWWVTIDRTEAFLTDAQADKLARKLLFEGDERPQGGAGAHNGA